LKLTWARSIEPDFESYSIYRSTSSGVTENSTLIQEIFYKNVTNIIDSSVVSDKEYFYAVLVRDTTDQISFSNELSDSLISFPDCSIGSDFIITEVAGNPVIPKDSNWNYRLVVDPRVQYIENKYFMWYNGYGLSNFQVGLAYSDDGYTWQNEDSNPVLKIGNDGDFDSWNIRWPDVIYDNGVYKMWYTGSTNGSDWNIGYATSIDGINWEKYDQNPVFTPGTNDWESYSVRLGAVTLKDEEYHLWYDGSNDGFNNNSSIGYARSDDCIHWQRVGEGPILGRGSEFFTSLKVSASDVHWVNDEYFEMFFTGANELLERGVGRAVSTNGLNWIHDPNNPIIPHGNTNSWNELSSAGGAYLKDGNNYKIWITGQDGYGDWNIGVADGEIVCE